MSIPEVTIVTADNYEEMYAESIRRLGEYEKTQVTVHQKAYVAQQRHHLHINQSHYKWCTKDTINPLYLCTNCGCMANATYDIKTKTQMLEKHTCFHCNYWNQISITPNPKRLIIDGVTYQDGGHTPTDRPQFLGFGGHLWTIEQNGRVWQTNNLWHGGTVPEEHRKVLCDNATFVKQVETVDIPK